MTWLVCLLLAQQASPELVERVNAGMRAKQAGDLTTAAREFRRVVELAPSLAAAHVNLGAVLFDAKDYAAAIPSLRRALELNQNLPGAQAMLGSALLAQGYASEAIPWLEKTKSVELLGVALLEAGREREAIDQLEIALAASPANPDLLFYLGQAHARLSKRLHERLTTEHAESARTNQLLGEAYAAAGKRDAAIARLQAALAQRADLKGVHLALGELAEAAGDQALAEREYRVEAQSTPGSAIAAFKLGAVLVAKGEFAAALAELERAERLRPGMPEVLASLGRAYLETGASDKAERAFRAVLAQEKTSSLAETAHFQLAQLLRRSGRAADADREMAAFRELRAKRRAQ